MLVGILLQGISYFMQGDFGLFVASFSVREGGSYCIMQLFEPMDSFGIPITNDYDCPLLSLTNLFHCIPAHYILQSISVIHECSPTCNLQCVYTSSTVERLSVSAETCLYMTSVIMYIHLMYTVCILSSLIITVLYHFSHSYSLKMLLFN